LQTAESRRQDKVVSNEAGIELEIEFDDMKNLFIARFANLNDRSKIRVLLENGDGAVTRFARQLDCD
jgi:hypothetical protein